MLTRFALLLALTCSFVFAQTNTGAITGIVHDSAGAVVPNAKVVIKEINTNATVNTVTTQAGNYTAPSLSIGAYEVAVTATGFKREVAKGIEVRATQTTTQ